MFPNILIELKKRRYSQQGLAKYIGISRSSMQNKMNIVGQLGSFKTCPAWMVLFFNPFMVLISL